MVESQTPTDPTTAEVTLWRYMPFSRFVWMLMRKALWMSRVDQLDDAWEMALTPAEMESLRPPTQEDRKHLRILLAKMRERVFVNCWTAADSESHAMWKVYCHSVDGVAVQTTLSVLSASVVPRRVLPMQYGDFDRASDSTITTSLDGDPIWRATLPKYFTTRKRKAYRYESEYRVVGIHPQLDGATTFPDDVDDVPGLQQLPWDPERYVHRVLIHPGADDSTDDAIRGVVDALAPALAGRVVKSGMAPLPAHLIDDARK